MPRARFWRRKKFWFRLTAALIVAAIALPGLWIGLKIIKNPQTRVWLPNYARDLVSLRYARGDRTEHMFVLLCDHWEPGRGEPAVLAAEDWLSRFKPIAARHRDSNGHPFRYSWFYPIDGFEPAIAAALARAAHAGLGEIEVHWHHSHDSSTAFESDLRTGLEWFKAVGALVAQPDDEPRFCFVHGNWALDNSRAPKDCGVDDEITILLRNGCYADLTFPSFGFLSQPATINRIYYAQDTPAAKSYDTGIIAREDTEGTGLMIIPGPLGVNFRNLLLCFETAAIDDAEGSGFAGKLRQPSSYEDYFNTSRVALWNNLGIGVEGRREWVFVKLHAHGLQHHEILLGGELDAALTAIERFCRDHDIVLHYIVAREAYNLVKAAERGLDGPPEGYFDLVIPPPLNTVELFGEDTVAHDSPTTTGS